MRIHTQIAAAIALMAAVVAVPGVVGAQQAPPAPVPLWQHAAPGSLGTSDEDTPTITPFLPPAGTATGAAVVIFPGGGYQHLATDKEGVVPAHWLNGLGIAAFVVKYRLGPRYNHPAMLQDAQRSVRWVRAHAHEFGVDRQRIGVLGFSAGGHMASTAGTHYDAGNSASADSVDRVTSRPDFMILLYPVITMDSTFTHRGSLHNLLGPSPSPELMHLMSNETQVTRDTPPAFLVATTDDETVPVENSLAFYRALHAASVPAELHLFEHGRHGFGLAPGNPVLSTWTSLCANWLRAHGWAAPAGH